MTHPSAAAASILRDRLGPDHGTLPFAEAVLAQLNGPAGALRQASAEVCDALAHEIAGLVLASSDPTEAEALALRLFAQPPLAAAFFQNLDLLYRHASPYADPVGALLLRTLELATAAEAGRSHG